MQLSILQLYAWLPMNMSEAKGDVVMITKLMFTAALQM